MGAALKSLNKEELLNQWPPGTYNIEKAVGMDHLTFCNIMNNYDSYFWRNLEEYPWFWNLYNQLKGFGDVIFCSKPAISPQSLKGKLEWLQDRFGKEFRDYVFTDKKFYLANPNTVLIDDDERQVDPFRSYGGKAILFPQLWNINYKYMPYSLDFVMQMFCSECL